ncbi:serine/threonine-protein phosphatase 6 regulatory ankyrin repeat subunit C-like [Schistocerca americana]|uniref:serine/threonine-protein phosphatase 6 regulatory ankyrin repeat subunit C-like n=1 Tax=Schistocerca americana TaxID=7009 RepID=UPI001F4F38B7|nr:serine/threonine-protein phosphatase 6 regulatory ankyrin repeat subunit C-like [Schistocerca americana]
MGEERLVHSLRDALASQPHPAQKEDADTQTATPVEPLVIQEATWVVTQDGAAQTIVAAKNKATQVIMEDAPCPLFKMQLQKIKWEVLVATIEKAENASKEEGSRTTEDAEAAGFEAAIDPVVSQADTYKKKKDKKKNLSGEERADRLTDAAFDGQVAELRALLAAGADIEALDSSGWTALHAAARAGNVQALKCLLAAGADVGGRIDGGFSALHWAATLEYSDLAKCLLEARADVGARGGYQKTSLHWAAAKGHLAVVRLLCAASAEVNARDQWGSTPLHYAASYDYTEVAAAMLEVGADRTVRDEDELTPLDIATDKQNQKLIDVLRRT